jgi:hypothetical protein
MKIESIAFKKVITKEIVLFAVFSIFAVFAPFFGIQAVTGPLVNAMLFLSTILLGVQTATLLAVFPSIIALSVGFLPIHVAPLIPFIIIGNIILVLIFNYFQDSFWKGVILASFSKFFFLYISSLAISEILFSNKIAKIATTMMSFPQLATALLGGLITYFVLLILKTRDNI